MSAAVQGRWRQGRPSCGPERQGLAWGSASAHGRALRARSSALALAVRLHQRLRIRGLAGHQHQRQDGQQVGQHQVHLIGQPGVAGLLQAQLQRIEEGEQQGTQQCLAGPPRGEHDQGHADPAAAVDHVEEERIERREREEAARHAHQRRACHDGAGARGRHRNPLAFGRLRVLAHHAHRQAQGRAVERPGQQRSQQQGEQRERRLRRENRHAQPFHRRERRDGGRRVHLGKAHAVAVVAERRRQQRDAQPRDVLRQRQPHGEPGMQQAEHRARERRHRHARPQAMPRVHGEPAGEGTRHHDPFDAQVQHARAFAQQHAQRAEDEGRRHAQRRDPEGRIGQDVQQLGHFQRTLYWASRPATSTAMSEAATITSAM